jgi:Rod binding domain-containing protein
MALAHGLTSPSNMMALNAFNALGSKSLALNSAADPTAKAGDGHAKARATAVKFEAQFLNSMFNEMFTDMGKDGPLGDGEGVGVWRSFLSEQYAKAFAQRGGVGIADHVYRTLIAQQEARAGTASRPPTP